MSTMNNFEDRLKEVNLQVTPARLATFQLFQLHDQPLDAQAVIDNLQKELDVDRVTVFRILNAFVKKGLLRKLEFGEGKARYELNAEEHHHLVCLNCGRIQDVEHHEVPSQDEEIYRTKGFLVKSHNVEFFGFCSNCQS